MQTKQRGAACDSLPPLAAKDTERAVVWVEAETLPIVTEIELKVCCILPAADVCAALQKR